jgi:prepilin peptidase dependent protein B
MLITRKQQTGLSLIELMIGLLVGLVIVAGGLSVFVTSVRGQADNIKLSRLNQDMRAMMDIMVRDIRRAGFVTSDPQTNLTSLQNNPFFGPTTDIAVWDYDGSNDNCIVYAYNRNDNSPLTDDDDERLGFRLNDGGNLEMRRSGTTNENCDNDDDDWESITESEVEINGLTFGLAQTPLNVSSMIDDGDDDGIPDGDSNDNGLCDPGEACNTCTRDGSPDPACLYVRNVTITLTGRLRDDNTVTQTITEQVRLRNDKYLAPIP